MKIKALFGFLIFFFLLIIPDFSYSITIEESIKYALDHSEAIRIALESAQTLRAKGRQISAFTKPQLNLELSYLEMDDNYPDPPFLLPGRPSRDVLAGYNASQLLWAGGRIWNSLDLKDILYRQADLLYYSGKRDIKQNVRLAFDNVLFKKAVLKILKDRLSQRKEELEDARDLREGGMVTSLDVRQARLNLNFSMSELKSGESSHHDALVNFNLAIGRKGDGDLWIPRGNLEDIPDISKILIELKNAFHNKELIDIKSKEKEAEAARLNHEIAKGEAFPKLMLVSSGTSDGEDFDGMNESWNIGLMMNWTILDGGLISSKKAKTRSEMLIANENLSKTEKDISGEIKKLEVNYESLKSRILIQTESVRLSKENYEDARGQYRAGMITQTRLGEFNLKYAESRFRLQNLLYLQRQLVTKAYALMEKEE